jgi:hypothetical protein
MMNYKNRIIGFKDIIIKGSAEISSGSIDQDPKAKPKHWFFFNDPDFFSFVSFIDKRKYPEYLEQTIQASEF